MQYDTCLEIAQKLEVIKERHLKDTPAVKTIADLIYKYGIVDLPYLNKMTESLLAAGITKKDETTIELTPETLLRSELLSEDLMPWAQKLRKKHFGSVNVPFTDYDSAVDWIKKYNVVTIPWKESTDIRESEPFRRNIRFYEHDDEETDDGETTVFARIGSPLEKIIYASQRLSKELEIGLDWNSLTFYVLADIPPFVPTIEVGISTGWRTLPSGKQVQYHEATATIREGFNLTLLKWLYQVLRQDMQLTKKKTINIRHLELYRLVQNKGGAPKGRGVVAFWKSVMAEWNTSYPKNKYKTWKGVKIKYERAISKLRANHIGWLQKEEAQHERSHTSKG